MRLVVLRLTDALFSRLSGELGSDAVLDPNDSRYDDYARDEGIVGERAPDAVVLAHSQEQLLVALALARELEVPVVPRGAGSGKVGGCVPVHGGIVLSLERMNAAPDVDPDSSSAIVHAGTLTATLDEHAAGHGLFYPPDPASLAYSTLGGNVATNAGGPRAYKYGVTGDYLIAATAVTMGGDTLRLGRRTAKGVSGYDLLSSLVGSEGTLALVTEMRFRLVPRPAATRTLMAGFADAAAAARAVTEMASLGVLPRAIELFDDTALAMARKTTPRITLGGARAALLIEVDGPSEVTEHAAMSAAQACDAAGSLEVIVAADAKQAAELWNARREVSPRLKKQYPHKVSEDICVPRSKLPHILEAIRRIAGGAGFESAAYGHAGDGNLHVNFLIDEALDEAGERKLSEALRALFQATIDAGGTLSGEHGIGLAKRPFMAIEHDETSLRHFRALKRMWDPSGLLNPGKVFPST